jgi:hypothetical protein
VKIYVTEDVVVKTSAIDELDSRSKDLDDYYYVLGRANSDPRVESVYSHFERSPFFCVLSSGGEAQLTSGITRLDLYLVG